MATPEWLGPAALALAAVATIGAVRAPLADQNQQAKESSDVYILPPPDQVVTLSLGYRSALADLLWAHVLVSQGLHTQERRRFENLALFLDSINELEPTFREPYLLADALFTFQTSNTPHEEIVKARQVMERGARELPLDGEVWLVLGQFVAFIAPAGYLTDPEEKAAWRLDGAGYLEHAATLGSDNTNWGWQALGGASILGRAGKRDAQIRFLERQLAVTDDPELRAQLEQQLAAHANEEQIEAYKHRQAIFAAIRKADLPFVPSGMYQILGPPFDPAYCTGPERAEEPSCALTWREWAAPPRPQALTRLTGSSAAAW